MKVFLGMALLAFSVPAFAASKPDALPPEYNRDIRPILSENCFTCHGPDSASRKAALRLDHFDDAIAPRKDQSPAIVPGKPQDSEIIHRISATNPDDIMPPRQDAEDADARSKRNCSRQWIADGAKYQPHWSFIAPVRPAGAARCITAAGCEIRLIISFSRDWKGASQTRAGSGSPHA